MSRREEVEKLVEKIRENISLEAWFDYGEASKALERIEALALESVPFQYVPREEVAEGWWSAKWATGYERRIPAFKVSKVESGELFADVRDGLIWPLDRFTDFLPVPAWLVEGIGE